MPPGRPSSYTDELAADLCERVIESDYGLEQVCAADDMPSPRTVYRWLADPNKSRDAFRQMYARAKELQGHVQADRGTKEALEATDASLGRLKWDARRWNAARLARKVYGDTVALTGSANPDDAPVRMDLSGLSAEQLKALASVKLPADR